MRQQEVDVPLSENEQRLLEQMERALSAEDPRFASAMRGSARAIGARRRLLLGALGVVVGLVVLLVGVTQQLIPVGVLGFVLMLAGTAYAAVSTQRKTGPAGVVGQDGTVTRSAPRSRGRSRRRSGFMQRMEQRWDSREE